MPLLLLLPLLLVGLIALWALLLPLALVQRFRHGRSRRRAYGWVVRVNAWLLLASLPLFLVGAGLANGWVPGALLHAGGGLGIGVVAGIVGLWLTRFERDGRDLHYQPPTLLVLLLTALVAARIAAGVWLGLHRLHAVASLPPLLVDHASLFGVGGILLGYTLAYAWGLKRRLAQRAGVETAPRGPV